MFISIMLIIMNVSSIIINHNMISIVIIIIIDFFRRAPYLWHLTNRSEARLV